MKPTLVLITDDDDDDRLFLRRAIERYMTKVTVCEAPNGEQALNCLNDQANQSGFDLVLLDVNMPGMSGIEVLDQIRLSPALKYTPTVILSTSDSPAQISQAYQKGANAYIRKPNSYKEYDTIIQAIHTCFLGVSLK